jgi:hypothetical protein
MEFWAVLPTELLWRYALAVIPLALVVAVLTRLLPCRPATRHTLWLVVLIWLVAAPLLPRVPSRLADPLRISDWGFQAEAAPVASVDPPSAPADSHAVPRKPEAALLHRQAAIDADTPRDQSTTCPMLSSSRGSVARSRRARLEAPTVGGGVPVARPGSGAPKMLAQATGSDGPPTLLRGDPIAWQTG